MAEAKSKVGDVRDRQKPLRVYVSPAERQRVEALARDCNLVPSAYLRSVGLGYQPRSSFDRKAVQQLAKLHADQGRLGGLLKLWLSEKRGEGAPVKSVRSLLEQIESLQMEIAKLVMEEARRL
jgi:hypothetical protein